MITEILVQIPAETTAVPTPATRYALSVAEAFKAHLTALVYEVEVTRPVALRTGSDPVPTLPEGQAAVIAAAVQAEADRLGISCETVTERSYAYGIGETLADFAHLRDVTVLDAVPDPGYGARLLIRAALYESGRPVILVPPTATSFRADTVLVAWDASRGAVRAVHDALPILKRARQVLVARVTDDDYIRSGHSGLELCRHLARHGVTCEFVQVDRGSASVPDALLAEAGRRSADLVVMGAAVHSRAYRFLFGSATERVLDGDLPVPVLLSH